MRTLNRFIKITRFQKNYFNYRQTVTFKKKKKTFHSLRRWGWRMNETPPNISPCCWLTKKSSRKWQWKWNIIFFFSKLMVPPWASWALKYGCFTKWNNFFILSFIALSVFFVCGVERHLLPFEIGNGQCNKRKTFVYLWLFTGNTETKKNVPTASLLGPSSTD